MRGHIIVEQAYAQGKMLHGSSWHGLLPRRITPSDIDMVIDNDGRILFCEFSSQTADWQRLQRGQHLLYTNLVLNGNGRQAAALCRHEVPTDQQIDTLKDVKEYSMLWMDGDTLRMDEEPRTNWPEGALEWLEAANSETD